MPPRESDRPTGGDDFVELSVRIPADLARSLRRLADALDDALEGEHTPTREVAEQQARRMSREELERSLAGFDDLDELREHKSAEEHE